MNLHFIVLFDAVGRSESFQLLCDCHRGGVSKAAHHCMNSDLVIGDRSIFWSNFSTPIAFFHRKRWIKKLEKLREVAAGFVFFKFWSDMWKKAFDLVLFQHRCNHFLTVFVSFVFFCGKKGKSER